jgi:hypothetical protein
MKRIGRSTLVVAAFFWEEGRQRLTVQDRDAT